MQRLLVADLEGTFIGDDDAALRLWAALDDAGVALALVTDRHLAAVQDVCRALGTDRQAAACICMAGTEIWVRRGRRFRQDQGWSQVIGAHWDRAAVAAAVESVGRVTAQHDEWQSPYRIGCFVEGDDPGTVVDRIRSVVARRGLRVSLSHSGGHLLDVVPQSAGIGSAAAFLARRLGVASSSVVTAGDSQSDRDMMHPGLGFGSIVVGNADSELRSLDGERIYQATQRYADGIAEGLQHFGWLGAV